jgi:hypothetical protein
MVYVHAALISTVKIDLEGVPFKSSLRLCLNQLGLGHYVRDGCLEVISVDQHDEETLGGRYLIAFDP